jgi:hypothetical protein
MHSKWRAARIQQPAAAPPLEFGPPDGEMQKVISILKQAVTASIHALMRAFPIANFLHVSCSLLRLIELVRFVCTFARNVFAGLAREAVNA